MLLTTGKQLGRGCKGGSKKGERGGGREEGRQREGVKGRVQSLRDSEGGEGERGLGRE